MSQFPQTFSESIKQSPVGEYTAKEFEGSRFGIISVYRSSEAMTSFGPLQWENGITFGKILVQRNEKSEQKEPIFFYKNFPENLKEKIIFIADPMVATGGSLLMAINCLIKDGVPEENINCVNIIVSMQGIQKVWKKYPNVKFFVAQIDSVLNADKYISPGLGDFGDRFYNSK